MNNYKATPIKASHTEGLAPMGIVIKDLSEANLNDHPCFKLGSEETVQKTKKWIRKVLEQFGPCVKVAYVDNEPVGMVQYAPMDILPHVKNIKAHETIIIHCIYVPDKKYQGKGIARSLIEKLIQDLQNPHPYLKGQRFKRIVALAGKNRQGPAGPIEFFHEMGFKDTKQISDEDVLVEIKLRNLY
jgi:ribosomal protein S18 acetylase RimI-like enzyme